MNRIAIGKILKAQGLRGEVKILPLTDDPARFLRLDRAFIDGKPHRAERARVSGGFAYVSFSGIDTREDAERLAGLEVSVDRADAVPLPPDAWYAADVLGCEVFLEDTRLGTLTDIMQNTGADVYTVRTPEGGEIMFPALRDLIRSVDTENKRMVLDGKRFPEVSVGV